MMFEQLENCQNNVIDVAEPTRFGLLGMVKASRPVDCNVCLFVVQFQHTPNRATRGELAVLPEPIKHRAVFSHVEPLHLPQKILLVFWGNPPQEMDVVIRVELCHLLLIGRMRSVDLHLFVQPIVTHEIMSHLDADGFHGVTPEVVISDIGVIEIAGLRLRHVAGFADSLSIYTISSRHI